MRTAIAVAVIAALTALAQAQDAPYKDDRSSAGNLIQSYYNAVNRREYARAWSYFGADKPAPDLDSFADGYSTTESVDLVVGSISSEGAAGSTFYQIAVAIRSTETGGAQQVFAGCYTARLANPQIQGDPFQPMHIVEGSLETASEPLEDAVPPQCGDMPPDPAGDPVMRRARELFEKAYGDSCRGMPGGNSRPEPESHTIEFRYDYDDADAPMRQARLVQFYCDAGAYNEIFVYYISDEIDGVRELHFASPDLDIRYENDDFEGAVEEIRIIGFNEQNRLVNSSYDPQTYTITSHSKWRGLGDASSVGTWLFRHGQFVLVKYEVDASYDGEINPEVILDYYSAP